MPLEGVVPALLTPFTEGGAAVDTEVLDAHLNWLHERGIHTVSPMGTTGEGASLSLEERKGVIAQIDRHPSGIEQIPGTGCTALPETIELCRFAVERGVAGILLAPPTYYVPDEADAVTRYYAAVLGELPTTTRVVLYHIPQQTRVAIEDRTITDLLAEFGPMVAGIKDSAGEFDHTLDLMKTFPEINVFNGNDRAASRAFAAGLSGVISASANVIPEEFEAVRAGDESRQTAITETRALADGLPRHAALKQLLHLASGLPRSSVRPPLRELAADEIDELSERFGELRSTIGVSV